MTTVVFGPNAGFGGNCSSLWSGVQASTSRCDPVRAWLTCRCTLCPRGSAEQETPMRRRSIAFLFGLGFLTLGGAAQAQVELERYQKQLDQIQLDTRLRIDQNVPPD